MPNHITTVLQTSNEAVLDALAPRNEKGARQVDFNLLIPFPAELSGISADHLKVTATKAEADKLNAAYRAEHRQVIDAGWVQADIRVAIGQDEWIDLQQKHGQTLDWYSWNIAHWGTKWQGYETTEEPSYTRPDGGEHAISFETAWSHPEPVIVALSQKFPDETLTVSYADEDLGRNLGVYTINNGVITWDFYEQDEPQDAKNDLAARIKWGQSYEELRREWDDEETDAVAAAPERLAITSGEDTPE